METTPVKNISPQKFNEPLYKGIHGALRTLWDKNVLTDAELSSAVESTSSCNCSKVVPLLRELLELHKDNHESLMEHLISLRERSFLNLLSPTASTSLGSSSLSQPVSSIQSAESPAVDLIGNRPQLDAFNENNTVATTPVRKSPSEVHRLVISEEPETTPSSTKRYGSFLRDDRPLSSQPHNKNQPLTAQEITHLMIPGLTRSHFCRKLLFKCFTEAELSNHTCNGTKNKRALSPTRLGFIRIQMNDKFPKIDGERELGNWKYCCTQMDTKIRHYFARRYGKQPRSTGLPLGTMQD